MANIFYNFTYDGTIEGLFCVYLKCLNTRVIPKNIVPVYISNFTVEDNAYLYIKTNYRLAEQFYNYIGNYSDIRVQHMVLDCFMTSIPNKEVLIYTLIRQALWRGNSVEDDFTDNCLHRIQMAIRELYREAQSIIPNINFNSVSDIDISIVNPRNIVLPIVKDSVLNNTSLDDFVLYDKRHYMALLRCYDKDYIVDTRSIKLDRDINSSLLYEKL